MKQLERNIAVSQMEHLLDTMQDAKEYGSILNIDQINWILLRKFVNETEFQGQMTFDTIGLENTQVQLQRLVEIVEIMTQKYDVVVTNPPYLGSARFSPKLSDFVNSNYADVKLDLSMVMFKKAITDFTKINGFISFITTTSWMALKSFESMRKYILQNTDIDSLVDFGTELFDGKVGHNPIVAWVTRKHFTRKKMTAVRLVDYCYAQRARKETEFFNQDNRYYPQSEIFHQIPGMPISAYWVSAKIGNIFRTSKLLKDVAEPKQGVATADNSKFLRLWFECMSNNLFLDCSSHEESANSDCKWYPYNKGGKFRKWYGNNDYVVNWEKDGTELKKFKSAVLRNPSYYFRECISWSLISSGSIAFRYKPNGHLFDVAGMSCFVNEENRYYLLALNNSCLINQFMLVLAPTINYQVGNIANIPVIVDSEKKLVIDNMVKNNILISKVDWDSFETSWDFERQPLTKYECTSLISDAFDEWFEFTKAQFNQLKANEEELNRIFIEIYGLQEELIPEIEDRDITIRKADLGSDIRSFVSYALGCIFGRYSLDVDGLTYAGGTWNDSKYSTFTPNKDNILPITDEEYFEDDIIGLFIAFVKKVYSVEKLEQNLDFIAKALGNRGNTSREIIRNYFVNDFFNDHCKIYQKRPIYWLFDSGKTDGFKALIYMHRYDENTIGNLRIDYLHQMQRVYDREIARMQETINNSTNAREVVASEKRKEKLTKQLKETKEYDEKIAHLALARIAIDLDDGVKVNYEKVQTGTDGKKLEVLAKI